MKKQSLHLKEKYTTAVSLIHGLNAIEIDYVISTVKSMRKLLKQNEIKNSKEAAVDSIPDDIDDELDNNL